MQKILTSYSLWRTYSDCRRRCYWRYIRKLVPLKQDKNLRFGTLIHKCLESWTWKHDLPEVLAFIDREFTDVSRDDHRYSERAYAIAMMTGYADRYADDEFSFTPVWTEKVFEGDIVNPTTGAASRKLRIAGKVDGLIKMKDGSLWLLENKTAAQIDGEYLEKLWSDFQTTLYSYYVETIFNVKLSGVLYNVLGKTRLKQGVGETEQEYQERYAELCAKSKTGKSTAKRKMPETDDEYMERLREWYRQPNAFHRERLFISRDRFELLQAELWEITQNFNVSIRRNSWYCNPSQCFNYGRCAYYPICSSGDNSLVIDNQYQIVEPFEELREELGEAGVSTIAGVNATTDLSKILEPTESADSLFNDELAALDAAIDKPGKEPGSF